MGEWGVVWMDLLVVGQWARGETVVAGRGEGKVVVKGEKVEEAMVGQEEGLAVEVVGSQALRVEVKVVPEEGTEEEGVAPVAEEEATVVVPALPVSLVVEVATGEAHPVEAKADLEGAHREVPAEMAEVDQQWK